MNTLKKYCLLVIVAAIIGPSCTSNKNAEYKNWSVYGGNKDNNRYSSLTQIDTNNVTQLQMAWQYHTGDSDTHTQIQTNPIIINNVLYGVSPKLKLFAVDEDLGLMSKGTDPQLERAITEIKAELKNKGYTAPKQPGYEKRN